MLRIRLRRQGAKKQPTYRIVVADQRDARDGRFVEIIGNYNPRTQPGVAHVDEARAFHWLGNGARPSDAVDRIFGWTGTRDRFRRLKEGEDVSRLLAEAEKAAEERPEPTKTRYDAPESAVRPQKGADAELEANTDGDTKPEAANESESATDDASENESDGEADVEVVMSTEAEVEVSVGNEADAVGDGQPAVENEEKLDTTTQDESKSS